MNDLDAIPDAARHARVIYVRPAGDLLMRADDAFRTLRKSGLSAKYDAEDLRTARRVIDELLLLAEQETNV